MVVISALILSRINVNSCELLPLNFMHELAKLVPWQKQYVGQSNNLSHSQAGWGASQSASYVFTFPSRNVLLAQAVRRSRNGTENGREK